MRSQSPSWSTSSSRSSACTPAATIFRAAGGRPRAPRSAPRARPRARGLGTPAGTPRGRTPRLPPRARAAALVPRYAAGVSGLEPDLLAHSEDPERRRAARRRRASTSSPSCSPRSPSTPSRRRRPRDPTTFPCRRGRRSPREAEEEALRDRRVPPRAELSSSGRVSALARYAVDSGRGSCSRRRAGCRRPRRRPRDGIAVEADAGRPAQRAPGDEPVGRRTAAACRPRGGRRAARTSRRCRRRHPVRV